MLYFIPAWYQQNQWNENEQYWYARRMHTEFDDTVKHVQLFHRSKVCPFKILLLSFAPNLRHFLHRQGVFRAPYWSCFDAIQEVRRKKVRMFSFHNLNWPEHIEFMYTPFALVALLRGKKYAQVEFGEDGNPIQVDIYKEGILNRRNIYDDRGFVSSTIVYENGVAVYQDYLTDTGVWKLRVFLNDGHVEVNPKSNTYLLEYDDGEEVGIFLQSSYLNMEQVITEVFAAYVKHLEKESIFCVAMHDLHMELVKGTLRNHRQILSFYENRYDLKNYERDKQMLEVADYIITDTQENLKQLQRKFHKNDLRITDITPFDSRVDFGISQQLKVQKILVPVDGLEDARYEELVGYLAKYLKKNKNAQVHLFTRVAYHGRKRDILEYTRQILAKKGFEEGWAAEPKAVKVYENQQDGEGSVPIRFFAEKCVHELAVSKCLREQRLIVDMRNKNELYLQITGISMGIPQIVYKETPFVEHDKNGMIVKNMTEVADAVSYYLDNLANWNEAVVHSYELGKKYTTTVLVDKWREVIESIGKGSNFATGEGRLE